MATQKTETTWKKKSIPLVRFKKDDPKGGVEAIEGVYLKRRLAGENTNEKTGEVTPRYTLIFKKLDSEEQFQVWETSGLKMTLESNDINEGDKVRIVHLGLVNRGSGKTGTVNSYDLYTM